MKPRTLFPTLLLLAALLFTGCGHTSPPETDGDDHTATPSPSGETSPEPSGTSAEPSDPADLPPVVDDVTDEEVLSGEGESYGETEDDGTLRYRLVNDRFYEVIGVKNGKSVLKIPAVFHGKPVKRIRGKDGGGRAFWKQETLISVEIPEGVVKIGDSAFYLCTYLQKITLPASLRALGEEVFLDCRSLESIEVAPANTVYKSEDGVLFDKAGTTLLLFPPAKRGEYAVPDGVREIDLLWCTELTSLTFPAGTAKIGRLGAPKLTSLALPEGLQEISSLYSLAALTELHIPASLTVIGKEGGAPSAGMLSGLEAFTVEEGNPAYSAKDGVLFDRSGETLLCYPPSAKAESYTLPEGVKTVAAGAINAPALKTLRLASTVRSLSEHALELYEGASLYIPAGVQGIAKGGISVKSGVEADIFCGDSQKPESWETEWYWYDPTFSALPKIVWAAPME